MTSGILQILLYLNGYPSAINTSIATKVYFVPGNQNVIAGYLSRFLNAEALRLGTCRFKSLNPLGMRWGLRKNDSYHTLVQAACTARLDNGSPHL
jgi:hypothetical protein